MLVRHQPGQVLVGAVGLGSHRDSPDLEPPLHERPDSFTSGARVDAAGQGRSLPVEPGLGLARVSKTLLATPTRPLLSRARKRPLGILEMLMPPSVRATW